MREIRNAVIVAYGRAPITRAFKGALHDQHPAEYAAQVLKGVLAKLPQLKVEEIDDVVVGCAKPEGVQGSNLARIIVQRAGLPNEVPGQTINRFCASGLQAIATAANAIMAGQSEVMVAGGVEDMTAIPMASSLETKNQWLIEHSNVYMPMGITAENVAHQYGLTRQALDAVAVESHRKAFAAQQAGRFDQQIIPVTVVNAAGEVSLVTKDEGIRPDTSLEGLAGLKTVFQADGVVTAGTASQLSDGAAFVVLMSEDKAKQSGIRPIARLRSFAVAGVAPETMGLGPIRAVPKAMALANLAAEDMDIIELNEAFAAQAIPCMQELGLDSSKVNPNGGAIALGHPLGATGAILTCKALAHLEETKGKYALVTMCIGGGMGAAGIFEMM